MRSVRISHSAMSRWILGSGLAVKYCRQLGVCHPLYLADGTYHHAESLDSRQIHTFSKIFVQNRIQFTTFVVDLRSS